MKHVMEKNLKFRDFSRINNQLVTFTLTGIGGKNTTLQRHLRRTTILFQVPISCNVETLIGVTGRRIVSGTRILLTFIGVVAYIPIIKKIAKVGKRNISRK